MLNIGCCFTRSREYICLSILGHLVFIVEGSFTRSQILSQGLQGLSRNIRKQHPENLKICCTNYFQVFEKVEPILNKQKASHQLLIFIARCSCIKLGYSNFTRITKMHARSFNFPVHLLRVYRMQNVIISNKKYKYGSHPFVFSAASN